MLIPPKYTLTPQISELLSSIEASKNVIDAFPIPPEVELNIRRQTTLKSSLFSAKIEGNPLTYEELLRAPSSNQRKAEVVNITKALNYISEKQNKDLTESEILKIHSIAMKGLLDTDNLGKFRKNMEAIFNSAGIAIYMPPPPRQVPSLMTKIVKYANSDRERFVPIKASLVHYMFERVHPFLDGSGRVGRLLIQKIMFMGGYGMKGLVPLEEYLENHRSTYYRMLEEPEKDLTDYLTFMLEAISESALKAREIVTSKKTLDITDYLLPRRAEILRIVTDQKMVNFDQIKRRFLSVNSRTLRYDLKQLQNGGHIKKLGSTRGAYYVLK